MVPFRKGADGVVARESSFAMRFQTFACERPPRLRRFGGFATFIDAAATPPHEEGNAPTLNSFSDLHHSRAVPKGVFLNSQLVENRQEEIRHGGVLWISNVASTLHPARCSARKDDGQRRM